MTERTPLLRAKTAAPEVPPHYVERPRLLRRLDRLGKGRLTLVRAGPGHGKSTLLAGYVASRGANAAWLRLDEGDQAAWSLFRYLVEALRRHEPEFARRSEDLWHGLQGGDEAPERLADIFLCDAEELLDQRMLLVLDGVEHIAGVEEIERFLRRVIDYLPPTLHLVLLGRSLPDLRIGGLLADGRAGELTTEALRFDAEEAEVLLVDVLECDLDAAALESLVERSRGWITALHLLARAGGPQPALADTPSIVDYLSSHVFAELPAATRRLLLQCSLLNVIDIQLVGRALPDSDVERTMTELRDRGLFVERLESEAALFAFEPLFRAFLRRRAATELPRSESRRLLIAYGRAAAEDGAVLAALQHLCAAEAGDEIVAILRTHARSLIAAGFVAEVRRAVDCAAGLEPSDPHLADVVGELKRVAGDHAAAIENFRRALEARREDDETAESLHGLAYSAAMLGQLDECETTAQRGLALARRPELRSRLCNVWAIALYRRDRLDEAIERWREALVLAREGDDPRLSRMIAHNLGLPYAVQGEFARASECFGMLTREDNPTVGPHEGAAYLNLARIDTLEGRYEEASRGLGDAEEIARKWDLRGLMADIWEARGNLRRATGDLDAARKAYAETRSRLTDLGMVELLDNLVEEEALLAAMTGRADEARRALDEIARRVDADKDPLRRAGIDLAKAEVAVRAGDPERLAEAHEIATSCARLFGERQRHLQHCSAELWACAAAVAKARSSADEERARWSAAADSSGRRAAELLGRHGYAARLSEIVAVEPDIATHIEGLDRVEVAARPRPVEAPVEPPADLAITLFGPFEVARDGATIPARAWKLRRALSCFCLIVLARGQRVTRDRLVDAVWGEAEPGAVEKNFHPTISVMRRALNTGRHVSKSFVTFAGGAYQLSDDYRYDVDVQRFDNALTAAETAHAAGERSARLQALGRAIGIYRAPLLEGIEDEWVHPLRAHYAQRVAAAIRTTVECRCADGELEEAIALAGRLVALEPADESVSLLLLETLGRAGKRAAIRREYDRLEAELRGRYESAPSEAIHEAMRRLTRA